MRKIIFVPYDFSDTAKNSAKYAFGFAKNYDLDLVFYHAFDLPVVTSEASFINYPYEEIMRDKKSVLQQEIESIADSTYSSKIKFDILVKPGFSINSIVSEAKELNAFLIIMGVTKRNKIGEHIIGSSAVFTARGSKIPVLIIPEICNYENIKKAVLSIDISEELNEHFIEHIKFWQSFLGSELNIISVNELIEQNKILQTAGELNAENQFSHTEHKTFYLEGEINEEIDKFTSKTKSQLLILSPKKHSILNDIFKNSTTKHFAYHLKIPILCILE
ncbi:MAG: universal stress protein [Bacteroidota bacterium]